VAIPFVVEDGSALANATSFITTDYFDNYFNTRGNTTVVAWTVDRKQKNINIASAYLSSYYRDRFQGRRVSKDQALEFPRYGVVLDGYGADSFMPGFGPITNGFIVDSNEIPRCVMDAVCEMAVRADTNVLSADIKPGAGNITMKKVGPIMLQYRAPFNTQTIWRYVDTLISPVLKGSSMSVEIVRS
jgi:hypothetical protein